MFNIVIPLEERQSNKTECRESLALPRVKNRRAALLTVILDHNVALRQFGGKIKKNEKKVVL